MEENSEPIEQHSVLKSVLLHLIPGIPILGGIFLFSAPVFSDFLGISTELSPLVGFILSVFVMLIPIQLAILLYEGKKLNNKLSLKGVIRYTNKSSLKEYAIIIPIILVFSFILFILIAPPVNDFMVEMFFRWYPQEYNFQNVIADPSVLSDYEGILIGVILYTIGAAILGPIVEELYFRGYLLPRMEKYGKNWAPVINVVLFSLYHFFSPWENPIRIIALIPMVYVVWKKKNIRYSIFVHVFLNCVGAIMMLSYVI